MKFKLEYRMKMTYKTIAKTVLLGFLILIILLFMINQLAQAQWSQQANGNLTTMTGVYFVNASTGFAVSSSGKYLKTTNGGSNWTTSTYTSSDLKAVYFINENTGYMVGTGGTIIRYSSGLTGTVTSGTTNELTSIQFTSSNTGYITGKNNTLLKTTNGGTVWFDSPSDNPLGSDDLYGLHFINNNTGWICGLDRRIRKTTNGGTDWTSQSVGGGNEIFYDIEFKDANTGIVVGAEGLIYRTTNGGTNWSLQNGFTTDDLFSVSHFNTGLLASEWYIGCENSKVLKSTNGGQVWGSQSLSLLPPVDIKNIYCLSSDTVYACGGLGRIYLTINGGGSLTDIQPLNNHPEGYLLSQNYPNPFNPSTNIKFSIMKTNRVFLTVFSINGELAQELINNTLHPGVYEVEFNASNLPSGTYFYRLSTEGFTDTKKMILIK
jgi:photosystem II stability/assembly factor-like uncharacterized protein